MSITTRYNAAGPPQNSTPNDPPQKELDRQAKEKAEREEAQKQEKSDPYNQRTPQ